MEAYKKYIIYGITAVLAGTLLILSGQVIANGPYLFSRFTEAIISFLDIISPVIFAFIWAYLLYIPVIYTDKLLHKLTKIDAQNERANGLIRLLSIVLVLATVLAVVVAAINYIIPPLAENLSILIQSLPAFTGKMSEWIGELTRYLNELNIDYTSNGELMGQINNLLLQLGQGFINWLTQFVAGFSTFVVDSVITIILTFYFLKDKERMFSAIDKLGTVVCSPSVKKGIKVFFKDLDDIVGKFLVGTILSCIIVGIISTGLMLLIGHPFAIIIGVGAGITNIIPYVGPIMGAGLAFGLGVFTSLELGILGAVLLLLYQQVDGNMIQPKIVGDKVGVAPVWILIAVLIGGSYFGGLGMIIAVPMAGLLGVYIDRLYKRKTHKKL